MSDASECSVDDFLAAARTIAEVMGGKWVMKRLEQEEADALVFKERAKDRRHAYMYRTQPHPLVQWILDCERVRKGAIETGYFRSHNSVLALIQFAQFLDKVKALPGFEKYLPRLRNGENFPAAAFEIETAASYVNAGNQVAFVLERSGERTPDIQVIRPSGAIFWVECKCRDGLNERDQKVAEFWVRLEQQILRFFGPNKVNATVVVRALRDPVTTDLHPLLAQIFASHERGGLGEFNSTTGLHDPVQVLNGRYALIVQPMTRPDEEIVGQGVEFLGDRADRLTMLMESRIDEQGRLLIRNPMILAFSNHRPMDKVRGLVNVLKSAADQLPKAGAGVVCIRLPDDFWSDDFDRYMAEAIEALQRELSGDHNRRITIAFIKSMIHRPISDGSRVGKARIPASVCVEHTNPYVRNQE